MKTETVEIKNRFFGKVMFTAGVDSLLSANVQLGAAIKVAVKAHANLAGANLAGAYLAGANLGSVNLAGADLAGANFAGAKNLLDCGTPHGYRVVANVFEGSVRIRAGCRSFTMAEAVKHWGTRTDRKLMLPLLAYIEAAARINKWELTAE